MAESSVLAWSHSRVDDYKRCPKMMWHKSIKKDVPFVQSEQMKWGDRVHKALEYRVRDHVPLVGEFAQYEPIASAIEKAPGHVLCETKITLNAALTPTGYFAPDAYVRVIVDVMKINGAVGFMGDYKGLALGTKLPTPTGWTTMADVQPGDRLIGSNGEPCFVTGKSKVRNRPCYKLVFDDNTTVVADDEHLWAVGGRILSTKEIADTLKRYGQSHHKIKLTLPIELPPVELPVEPYLLGCWLGDGKHSSGEICKPDEALWDNIRAKGHRVGPAYSGDRARTSTVYGLRTALRRAGLLRNKHIPAAYLRASYQQRLDLLRGLMDTDGSVNSTRRQCVFSSCDKALSDAVVELLLSLGQRPLQSKVLGHGFGKDVIVWPVGFKPLHIQPFALPRKANLVAPDWGQGNSWRRLIVSADEVQSVPTQCVSVDSPDSTYLCTERMLVTHNTGKIKFDEAQLKLFAAVGFQAYPQVNRWTTAYIWTKDKVIDPAVYTREQIPQLWQELLQVPNEMQKSHVLNHWPAKPGFSCKYCGANKYGLCESASERYKGD